MASSQKVSHPTQTTRQHYPYIAFQQPMGPPYAPRNAGVGGIPTIDVDIPICAGFLFLFIIGAASHMPILQVNMRKGQRFIMSGLLFGFCMARTVTNIMRIVWACFPTNVSVAIVAMIFVSAGVLIVFLINLIFAQRIIRAAHTHFGWHRAINYSFVVMYVFDLADADHGHHRNCSVFLYSQIRRRLPPTFNARLGPTSW